jgi:hypothetical protein
MSHRLIVLGAAVVLLLAGCAAVPTAQPTRNFSSAPVSSGPVPDVPLVSGKLSAPRPVVPPVSVEVPSAGIVVSVTPVGVESDGLMELPADVKIAGWYRYGANPMSKTGTTVIAAHVDSVEYGLGPFAGLKGLAAGTEVVVTLSSGKQVRYAIESVTSVVKEELPLSQVFDRDGDPRLALITCGGQFNYSTGSYSDNILVIAAPVTS